MCHSGAKIAGATALLLMVTIAAAPSLAVEDEALTTGQAEDALEAEPPDLILAALPASLDLDHFKRCDTSPRVILNEVCSVGTECDPDVRVADFIELYNPSEKAVDLACFVLINGEGIPFFPRGEIEGRRVKAWGEKTLGFRVLKTDDVVVLLMLGTSADGDLTYLELESLTVRENQAHSLRLPDGGSWTHETLEDAESDYRGTFDRNNSGADEGQAPDS